MDSHRRQSSNRLTLESHHALTAGEVILNAIVELINLYNATSPGDAQHDIARIMLDQLGSLRTLSIDKIAEQCSTSAATLSRLARSLGFTSFSEFRANLVASFDNYPFLNHTMQPNRELTGGNSFVHAYFYNVHSLLDRLEQSLDPTYISAIISAIDRYSKVCLYSQQIGDFPTLQFQYDLIMAGKSAVVLAKFENQLENARTLDKNSFVIVCLPDAPDSAQRLEALREAHRRGACTLLIKPRTLIVGPKYADYVIDFDESRTASDGYIYDVIISLLAMRYRFLYLS